MAQVPIQLEWLSSAHGNTEEIAVRAERQSGLEWTRFFAAVGIVWFHVKAPGDAIAYGGLPVLMAMSVALAVASANQHQISLLLVKRFYRLLVPWLAWSVIYAIAKIAQIELEHADYR